MNVPAITLLINNRNFVYWSIIIAFAGTVLGFAVWPRSVDNNKRNPERKLFVDVKRAISGQKIRLDDDDEEYLVYAGVRAPNPGEPLHEESLRRNGELVAQKEIRLRFGKKRRDRKGRLQAFVFQGDEFVNETLVREGLAYVRLTSGTRRRYISDRLLSAQSEARKHRRGLWKVRPRSRESAYHGDPKYGNFHRTSCDECAKINPNRLVILKSARSALDDGYAPCPKCKP